MKSESAVRGSLVTGRTSSTVLCPSRIVPLTSLILPTLLLRNVPELLGFGLSGFKSFLSVRGTALTSPCVQPAATNTLRSKVRQSALFATVRTSSTWLRPASWATA